MKPVSGYSPWCGALGLWTVGSTGGTMHLTSGLGGRVPKLALLGCTAWLLLPPS